MMDCCPICAEPNTKTFIEISNVPVHCNLLWEDQSQARLAPRGDIRLGFCPSCGHIFNSAFDPQKMHYSEAYENSLHFSPRFQQYADQLASGLVERYGLFNRTILEIGAGQGDFLSQLCRLGSNRGIGYDPSYSPEADDQSRTGVQMIQDYYSEKYADQAADLILSRHVFEHLSAPGSFLVMLRRVIGERDHIVVFFEVPNVLYTLRSQGIWDIIYEHYSYFSPESLSAAFRLSKFDILRVDQVFGGQFLTIEAIPKIENNTKIMPDENGLGQLRADVDRFERHYTAKVKNWELELQDCLHRGARVVVWGSGSKGVMFLNTLKARDAIQYVVDINPRKQGKFVAGTGQPIVPPDFLVDFQPEAVIVMNRNYEEEIRGSLEKLNLSNTPIWLA